MKVNRKKLEWYLTNIRSKNKELSDSELVNELANWMEVNPACVDINEESHSGRYYYSTVGYGVFSLLGERYRIGRVEIFDKQNDSGYQVDEGSYCMPFTSANQFEDFMNTLQTDYPINIEIGSYKWCQEAVSEELGIPIDKLNDTETKKAYYKKQNDESAQKLGFKDFDEQLEKSGLGDLRITKKTKD
jgi:hypothetical protein